MRARTLPPVIQSTEVSGAYCKGCTYQPTGVRRVPPDGSGTCGVALVGDSPWVSEVAANRVFVGASGSWLDSILSKRGLAREDFITFNAGTQCKPPTLGMNDEPEKHYEAQLAIRQCEPYLREIIRDNPQIKVMLAQGKVALQRLTGFTNVEGNNAYVIQSDYGLPVVPTMHPSGIIQGNWNLTIGYILALARAVEIANGSFVATPVKVIEDPDPSYLAYPGRDDITIPVMCDIETPKSIKGANEEEAEDDPSYQIIRMGFAIQAWQGVSFPFEGDYIRRAKELIRRARVVIFWNKNYDLPRLKKAGFEFHQSVTIVDAMWAWHWLYSDLPKALAFAAPFFYSGAPWKHLASQRPSFYNAMDNAIQMGVYQGTKAQLERDNRWDRFWAHCVKVDPIYVRYGQEGIKVDKVARTKFMDALKADAKSELVTIQSLLPHSLVKVKESFKELKPLKVEGVKPTRAIYNSLIRVEKVSVPFVDKEGKGVLTEGGGPLMRPLYRRNIPFNPWAREDLLELMRTLGVRIPKARGEDRESAESKYLKRLTKHPIFRHCVSYKQRTKLVSTYDWPLSDTQIPFLGEVIVHVKSSLEEVNSVSEVGDREKVEALQRRLREEESSSPPIQSDLQKKTPHPIHLWGSWVGPTPSSDDLSKVPSVISGREAVHPSLGLGRLKQRSQQLSSGLCFVPYKVSSDVATIGPFILPIERTITSTSRAKSIYGFHPSTWRSSSRNVNLGNIPKRFELAKLFRELLIAEDGYKLIEIDRSALEAVLVGYWAKSPSYINLAKAGVHSMLVSHVIGDPVPDTLPFLDLKRTLKEIKKRATVEQYEGCKRCIHGSNYLLSPYGMHDEYEEFFPTEYAAQRMQDIYFGTPAGQTVRAWHKATIEEAYSKKYLDNSFQYRHYFYGPMYKFNKRDKAWSVDHEGDAKRAVAFRPQSDGAAIQREDILAIEPVSWLANMLRLPTYDSLVAECPNGNVDRAIELLAGQFDKPIPELLGLDGFDGRIGFEIKVGDSLGKMSEVSL